MNWKHPTTKEENLKENQAENLWTMNLFMQKQDWGVIAMNMSKNMTI